MQTINNILKQKGPHFNVIDPDRLVREALVKMKAGNISYLLVKEGERFLGIFSEREYAHHVILEGKHSDSTKVKEVLMSELAVIDGSQTPENALRAMNSHKTRYLAVYNEFSFAGILTLHDLMRDVLGVWVSEDMAEL